jgi:glycerol-3-phosphate dehydrogenase
MAAGRLAPALGALTVAGGALATYSGAFGAPTSHPEDRVVLGPVPSRAEAVARLKDSSPDRPFDVLIIGGGATGAGCAVDAATR